MASFLKCIFCGRADFASSKGLKQHQQRNKTCNKLLLKSLQIPTTAPSFANNYMHLSTLSAKKATTVAYQAALLSNKSSIFPDGKSGESTVRRPNKRAIEEVDFSIQHQQASALEEEDDDFFAPSPDAAGVAEASYQQDSDETEEALECDNLLRKAFNEYVSKQQFNPGFTPNEVNAINLLCALRQTRAPYQR